MSKVTMPEPVAYFYQRDFDKYKDRYPGGIPVITTAQAESYANAKVQEALEKAESMAGVSWQSQVMRDVLEKALFALRTAQAHAPCPLYEEAIEAIEQFSTR